MTLIICLILLLAAIDLYLSVKWIINFLKKNLSDDKTLSIILFISLIILSPTKAHADNEAAKALLGSFIEIISTEAIKDPQTPTSHEEIRWSTDRLQVDNQTKNLSSLETKKNKEIQAHLTRIGFYYDEIDGIAGPPTTDAIRNWEHEFNLDQNGQVDNEELEFLKTLAQGGFTNKIEYDQAKERGFKTRKEYLAAKQITSDNQETKAQISPLPDNHEVEVQSSQSQTPITVAKENAHMFSGIYTTVFWFSGFFIILIFIVLIKRVIQRGNQYELKLIFSAQFLILLLGIPFAAFVAIESAPPDTSEISIPEFSLFLFTLSIPVMISYVLNARSSSYLFAIPYTLIQLACIPLVFFVILFIKAQKDKYDRKRGYI